jgi:hypothetical protein
MLGDLTSSILDLMVGRVTGVTRAQQHPGVARLPVAAVVRSASAAIIWQPANLDATATTQVVASNGLQPESGWSDSRECRHVAVTRSRSRRAYRGPQSGTSSHRYRCQTRRQWSVMGCGHKVLLVWRPPASLTLTRVGARLDHAISGTRSLRLDVRLANDATVFVILFADESGKILDLKQTSLHRRRSAQSPQQVRQAEHQFTLGGRGRVVVGRLRHPPWHRMKISALGPCRTALQRQQRLSRSMAGSTLWR